MEFELNLQALMAFRYGCLWEIAKTPARTATSKTATGAL
jgi:hypothetical protein